MFRESVADRGGSGIAACGVGAGKSPSLLVRPDGQSKLEGG